MSVVGNGELASGPSIVDDGVMRAAILEQIPGQLTTGEVDLAATGPDEVLVRTVACGLCHSDLHVIDGKTPLPVPAVLGHEAAGIVEAVGADVTEFHPGDHVVGCLNTHCNRCRSARPAGPSCARTASRSNADPAAPLVSSAATATTSRR